MRGALAVARYNWPFYALAGTAMLAGLAIAGWVAAPAALRLAALAGAVVAAWFAGASFLAALWVFDRSGLTRWQWLPGALPAPPARWVLVNAGLDETQADLFAIFPGAEGMVLDVYDPAAMSQAALGRARGQQAPVGPAARLDSLPVADRWAQAVFLLLTAHEVRRAGHREAFFRELARILAPDGRLVLVEHARDLANALAFGPGVLHFLPRREWLRVAAVAGLQPESERRFTPFVRVFTWRAGVAA